MKRRRLCVVSLGCPKNLVDTETMLGQLVPGGYELEYDPGRADAILINTCSFIAPAREETLETIAHYVQYKTQGRVRAVVVTGCMAQSHRDLLEERFPEVDAFLGLSEEAQVAHTLDRLLPGVKRKGRQERRPEVLLPYYRLTLTPPHTAYLRVSDGCDHTCSFCVIPRIRGRHQSRPMEDIAAEAQWLVSQGVRELNLISQDTTAYGRDTTGRRLLPDLLRRLCKIQGVDWIRVFYAYPSEVTDELIEVMADEEKVTPYLDIPLQHASAEILQAMRRPATTAYLEGLIERLRNGIPDLSLRSTFIVGFPGETDQDFNRLMEFCRKTQFDYAGCFLYSPEEDSPAAALPDPVPNAVAQERHAELFELLQEISEQKAAARVGQEAQVLIDAESDIFPDFWRGRHSGQAPDIDGVVYVPRSAAQPGQLIRCAFTAHHGYDLFAEPV